jgi:hypothetical protein
VAAETWVTNASPVIALAKAGYVRLLEELPVELLLPEAVVSEVLAGPEADPGRKLVEGGWGKRVNPVTIPSDLLEWGLGRGETAVLALARVRAGSLSDRIVLLRFLVASGRLACE